MAASEPLNLHVFRHSERDKVHPTDPQSLTRFGFELSILMGSLQLEIEQLSAIFCSPQGRTYNTIEALLIGIGIFWSDDYKVLPGLSDWSSDERPEIREALEAAIAMKPNLPDLGVDQIILLSYPIFRAPLQMKVIEAFDAIEAIRRQFSASGGDILLCMHGATIDALYSLYNWLSEDSTRDFQDFPWAHGVFGEGDEKCADPIRYSEGFHMTAKPGDVWPTSVEHIRWPKSEAQLRAQLLPS